MPNRRTFVKITAGAAAGNAPFPTDAEKRAIPSVNLTTLHRLAS